MEQRYLKLLVGNKKKISKILIITSLILIGVIFLVSALTLEEELSSLEQELIDGGYGWLVDYSGGDLYPSIEVYLSPLGDDSGEPKIDNESIATFDNISSESWYKVYLTNLGNVTTDIFDLKVLSENTSGVEFDYIVDPVILADSSGDWNGTFVNTTITGNNVTLNLSSYCITGGIDNGDGTCTIIINATNDGYTRMYGEASWSAARDVTSSEENDSTLRPGIDGTGGVYTVGRVHMSFNLSSLPIGLNVTSAILYLYGTGDWSDVDDTYLLINGTQGNEFLPQAGWFNDFTGWAASGAYSGTVNLTNAWSTSTYLGTYNQFNFSSIGRTTIQNSAGSILKTALLSGDDIRNRQPSDSQVAYFQDSSVPSHRPYINITYKKEYYPTGTYTSQVIDAGADVQWNNISWSGTNSGCYAGGTDNGDGTCTLNITATNDGSIRYADGATYLTARDASSGTTIPTGFFQVGQFGAGAGTYQIGRGFASFVIPDIKTLTSASLFLYGQGDQSTTDFNISVLTSTYTSIAITNYTLFDGHQASGAYTGTILNNAWNSVSYSATWNKMDFNSAGLNAVLAQKGGTFKMAAISKEDYDNSAPVNSEYVYFYPSSASGKEPTLSITYPIEIKFQARSCDDASCSGETFVGPSNTSTSYFTSSPVTLNTTLTPNNQYFQYKTFFLTGNTSLTPHLASVSVDYSSLNAAPSVSDLNSPANASYLNSLVSLTWSNSTDPDSNPITYYLEVDDNSDFSSVSYVNTSITETTNTTGDIPSGLSEGKYYWRVLATDGTLNSSWSQTWEFTYETTSPSVTIIYPTNNSNFNTKGVNVNITITDTNLQTCWYSNDSGVINNTFTCGTNLTNIDWEEGSNVVYVYANDSAGNENSSSVSFSIDIIYPLINFTSPTPANNTYLNVNSVYVNYSVTETNPAYSFINFDRSLVGWWTMDDVNGSGSPLDISGYGNNGSALNGAVQTSAGKFGKGFSFDGVNDYVDIPPTTISGGLNYTICQWVYIKDIVGSGFIFNSNLNTRTYIDWTGTNLRIRAGTELAQVTAKAPISANTWYHVCFNAYLLNATTYNLTAYGNGVFSASNIFSGIQNATGMRISSNGAGKMNGSIDDVMIFNRSLSAEEITALYNATQTYHNFTSLSEGTHTYQANVVDIAGNRNSTEQRQVNVDTIQPSITISYPTNNSYNTNVSELNYTFTETNPDSCWYSLDSGDTNSSRVDCGTNWTGLTSTEGTNIWKVYINDTLGNLDNSTIQFSKDTVYPVINVIYPLNTTYATTQTELNYTFTEINPDSCWYSLDSGATNSSRVDCGTNWTGLTSTEGTNIWNVYLNDTSGNQNSSLVYFFVDATSPSVTIVYPTNNSNFNTKDVNVNMTMIDTNLQTCWYSNNSGQTNNTFTCGVNLTSINWEEGSNVVYVYANDSSGNTNASELISFTVDTTNPLISLISPVDAYSTTVTTTNFTYNVTDENLVNCSLVLDGVFVNFNSSVNTTGGVNYFTNNTAIGNYTWSVNCTDNLNNQGNSSTRTLSITQASSFNSINATPAIQGFGLNVTIEANITQGTYVPDVLVEITDPNSALANYSMENISLEIWQYNYVGWLNGTYNYKVYANNSLGTINSSTGTFNLNNNLSVQIRTLKDNYGYNETVNITDPPEIASFIEKVFGINLKSVFNTLNSNLDKIDFNMFNVLYENKIREILKNE